MYRGDVGMMLGMSVTMSAIFYQMIERMNYSNKLVLSVKEKREFCDKLGICKSEGGKLSMASFNNFIYRMEQRRIIVVKKGNCIINPYLFAKGSWDNVVKVREEFDRLIQEIKQV
jgi:hypothetical protein